MEKLTNFTRSLVHTKALESAADRMIQIATRSGPAMLRKAGVPGVGTADVPAFVNDPDAVSLLSVVNRRNVIGRLGSLGAVSVPPLRLIPVGDVDPTPAWVGEGLPRPVARLSTTSTMTGTTSYLLLIVLLAEFLKLGDQRSRNLALSRALRGLVNGDDSVFLGTAAASAAQPAGILWNRTQIGAGSPNDLQSDMENLYATVADGAPFAPVFILSGRAALYLSATGLQAFKDLGVLGGTIAGAPALISPSAGANLILVDASEIAYSDGGLDIVSSESAAVQMVDGTPTPGATSVVSMFQTNSACLKLERFLSWALLREDAVQFVSLPIGGSPA